MAVTVNPDKEIRKAVFELVDGISVSAKTINCFDTRLTGASSLSEYVLMTSQTKEVIKPNKCDYRWETSLLIEIYTKNSSAGNPGSRVLLNDIEQAVYTLLQDQLFIQGFTILIQNVSFEAQLDTITTTENIYRSFLRLNLTLI